MNKAELRKEMLRRRRELSPEYVEAAGEAVLSEILDKGLLESAKCVFVYVDMKNEIPTRGIICYCLNRGIRVCVPKIVAPGEHKIMKAFVITDIEADLTKGYFGIMEPVFTGEEADEREVLLRDIDIVFLPGSVFDTMGNRIGYGAGFYDDYLALHGHFNARKVALCYDFQVVDRIEPSEHDVPVDIIFTEKRVISCREAE